MKPAPAPRLLLVAILVLIGMAAFVLDSLRSRQRLGEPGLVVSRIPLLVESNAPARAESIRFPDSLPGFSYSNVPVAKLELEYLPPDTTFGRGQYTAADGSWSAAASAVLMGTDRTSIHRPEYCLQGVGWQVGLPRIQSIPLRDGTHLEVQRIDCRAESGGSQAGVYVFWFVADGQRTASHWVRQSSIIRDLLTRNTLPRWAYLSFLTTCAPGDEDNAFARLAGLIAECEPHLARPRGTGAPPTAAR